MRYLDGDTNLYNGNRQFDGAEITFYKYTNLLVLLHPKGPCLRCTSIIELVVNKRVLSSTDIRCNIRTTPQDIN